MASTQPLQMLDILELERCPHCRVDQPMLSRLGSFETRSIDFVRRLWNVYACRRCGMITTAWSRVGENDVVETFPTSLALETAIPEKAREYLRQAIDSINAPSGAIMLCASSVDAMLKVKGYREGSLYERIDKAEADLLITSSMKAWAHKVRLDANDERHADVDSALPTIEKATLAIEFTRALGQFLFVLPAMVDKGLSRASESKD